VSTTTIANENVASVGTDVKVYVAKGLSVSVPVGKELQFPDIVIPSTGETSGVTLDCADGISYLNNGSTPNSATVAGGQADANDSGDKKKALVGQAVITGESDYSITVTFAAGGAALPTGIESFEGKLNAPGADASTDTNGPLDLVLDGAGSATVNLCVSIEINDAASSSTNMSVPAAVTVTYR
jgi:hypothetical protein